MGKTESIRDSVADVRVHTGDIHPNCGKWICRTFTSGTNTYILSSNVTVTFPFIIVTAAAAGFVTMGTTATATAIMASTSTAAGAYYGGLNHSTVSTNAFVVTAANASILEMTSGTSIIVCAVDTVRGKYGFFLISTPT